MTLPDPNAATGVPTDGDTPPPGWTGKLQSREDDPNHPWAFWYLDVPGTSLRIVEAADWVHASFFPSTGRGAPNPRAARPSHPNGAWRIRQILLHQTAGALGDPEDNEPEFGMPPKVVAVPRNMGLAINHERHRYRFAGMAYHVIVPYLGYEEDGRRVVYKVQDFAIPSGHASTHAIGTLGINLQGTFRPGDGTDEVPSAFQMAAIAELIPFLQAYYGIQNTGIQGHFLHNVDGRSACPGYDGARWALDRQEEHEGGHFCYPIALEGRDATFLPVLHTRSADGVTTSDAAARSRALELAADYMENSERHPGGSYPYGRRPVWHDGVHLFPRAAGEPVRCVRHGWVVAAALGRTIRFRDRDLGSASFVLVQHADSGCPDPDRIYDPRTRAKWGTRPESDESPRRHMAVCYYSLYMHLQPLADAPEEPSWLAELERRDAALAARARSGELVCLGGLPVPVVTGQVLGYTGTVDPFVVARADDLATEVVPVLHFEMFSHQNLVAVFEDEALAADWTIEAERDGGPLAAEGRRLPPNGLGDVGERLARRLREADEYDPQQELAQLTPQSRDPVVNEALSKVIARHVSEHFADWEQVSERTWAEARPGSWNTSREAWDSFRQEYLPQVQWLRALWEDEGSRWALGDAVGWLTQLGAVLPSGLTTPYRPGRRNPWPSNQVFFHFHPLRLLNWLNGLQRTMRSPGPYYAGGEARSLGPINRRQMQWRWVAGLSWTEALSRGLEGEEPGFYEVRLHEASEPPQRLKRRPTGVIAVFDDEEAAEESAARDAAWRKPDGTFESWAFVPSEEALPAYRRVLELAQREARILADCATRADALALVGGDEERVATRTAD